MEKESYFSFGGNVILLALFAQRYILSRSSKSVPSKKLQSMKSKFFVICKEYKKESNMSQRKYTPLYEKDTKQNQNSPMETSVAILKTILTSLFKM